MGKISKSQHFEVGTFIVHANVRGEVLERIVSSDETHLRIKWHDGSMSLIKPFALNR